MKMGMIINEPEVIHEEKETIYRVQVQNSSVDKKLWYSVPKEFGGMISSSGDAALVALLFPAMAKGENIRITGSISEELFYNLQNSYQEILRIVFPSLKRVAITPEKLSISNDRASGVATAFSAGIDSFSVLADHHYAKNVPEGFRLTHLVFNNVGSHGAGGEQLFRKRYKRVEQVAEQIGLPILAVNSNLDSFYIDLGFPFIDTHTPRNASVAHLLAGGIGRYLYASTYDYRSVSVGPSFGGLPRSEPIILPLLSTPSVDLLSCGSEYSRVEKTLNIASIKDTYSLLDICVMARQAEEVGAINCSKCWKCMRTELTLEIAGLLENYENMFDLDVYRSHRNRYLAGILKSDDPLTNEILLLAKQRNFEIPRFARILASTGLYKLFPFVDRVLRYANNILNRRPKVSSEQILRT